ncbi:hypothetical protein HK102_000181 [Quaeritorhiza haematococci]|nr:hypothetical protein HK102_000181 [Quaeritorhiza haematococci]
MFFSKASTTIFVVAASLLATFAQPTTAAPNPIAKPQTQTNACSCTVQPTVAINGACFCGPEAEKIQTCIRQVAPNFPFAPQDPAAQTRQCPSPIQDPAGFSKCIQDKSPKPLPNASQISQDCVRSTGARPN